MNDGRPLQPSRRGFCAAALGLAAGVPRVALGGTDTPIRIGTTSVILDNQVGFLQVRGGIFSDEFSHPCGHMIVVKVVG